MTNSESPEASSSNAPISDPHSNAPRSQSYVALLLGVLREATDRFPQLRYVWGVLGIFVVLALVSLFHQLTIGIAFVSAFFIIWLMIALLFFEWVSPDVVVETPGTGGPVRRRQFGRVGDTAAWMMLVLWVFVMIAVLSSVFLNWPLSLGDLVFGTQVKRRPYIETFIPATAFRPVDYCQEPNAESVPYHDLERARMRRWQCQTLHALESPGDQKAAIVLLQDVPFDANYETITVALDHHPTVDLLEGYVFLYHEEAPEGFNRPVYRQMPLTVIRSDSARVIHLIEMSKPNAGERIVALLSFAPAKGIEKLPARIESFELRIGRR